ncbi:MAG: hypothetical protein AMXMBFR4_03770 [Candidatus Hydrogenedentota bacterium]
MAVGAQAAELQPNHAVDSAGEENANVASEGPAANRTNRLIHETSPYLLQHARNPVDWYPWGEEALRRAREEDKPIFLSIGYSACHWCHVMEHESFENEEIAAILNEHFISIKVDREERPDLDEIYMTAVQIMTGSGGWPMTVFLRPDRKPFYGGTYYPPVDRMGRPGFKTVLNSIAQAWKERRDEIDRSAEQLTQYVVQSAAQRAGEPNDLDYRLIEAAVAELKSTFDSHYGGFGGAPKFPSGPAIELLLRHHFNTGDNQSLEMAAFTLTRMWQGGMYDHLGGGFHRYSVDAKWLVPHFEKMLYDNAQLCQVYLDAYQATGDSLFARVAREILDYELRDMQDDQGAFHSTEDADSEEQEGKFYVWTQAEIDAVLGDEDGYLFCQFYNVRPNGNFDSHEPYHEGQNILHVTRAPDIVAKEFGMETDEFERKLAECRAKLLEVRNRRVRPGLDDKILASWNGLIISALARAHQVFGEAKYRHSAERAASFVMNEMQKDGVLLRTHRGGQSRVPGYLDDYAFLCVAFIDLYEATFDEKWLDQADALASAMIERFWDGEGGGFYFTSADHRDLLVRTKPTYDGAEPSGNSMAALALLRLGVLIGNKGYADKAHQVLRLNQSNLASAPRAYLKMLCAADFVLNPPKEIALVGNRGSDGIRAFVSSLHERFVPNKVIVMADSSNGAARLAGRIPLLAGKTLVRDLPAAYVCRDYACQQPATTVEEFVKALGVAIGGAQQ